MVNEVVMEWESVVNRVAKCELGEKMIVWWWDEQIKDRIDTRREVYRKVVNGREDLWDEYNNNYYILLHLLYFIVCIFK